MIKLAKKIAVYGLLAAAAWLLAQLFVRPGMEGYRATLAAPADDENLTITWFGVSTVLIDDGTYRLLIDPFFSRHGAFTTLLNLPQKPLPGLAAAWLERADVQSVDAVLVSHSHYDHILDVGEFKTSAIYGSETSKNIALGHGLARENITTVVPDQPYKLGPYTVTFVETPHAGATGGRPEGTLTTPLKTPARTWDYKLGGAYSIHIEHPQGRMLHIGSAGVKPGALSAFEADTVLLGIAVRPELAGYLQETAYATGAKNVVPIHWDDFLRPLSSKPRPLAFGVKLDSFYRNMKESHPKLRVISAPIGQPITAVPNP